MKQLSTRKPLVISPVPEWLTTYKKRTALIDVIAMAFNPQVTDADVRKALIEVSETLGEMFQPGGQGQG